MNRRLFLCSSAAVAVLATAGLGSTDVRADATKSEWTVKWNQDWKEIGPYWVTTYVTLAKGDHTLYRIGKSIHSNDYDVETEDKVIRELLDSITNVINDLPYFYPEERQFLIKQAYEGSDNFYYE